MSAMGQKQTSKCHKRTDIGGVQGRREGKEEPWAGVKDDVRFGSLTSRRSLIISLECFQQLFQLFECFGVIRADWRVVAAGIRSLQSATHGARKLNWSATVIDFAHEIPLGTGLNVATKAVSSKAIDHFGKSPFSDFRSILGNVQLKELPVLS